MEKERQGGLVRRAIWPPSSLDPASPTTLRTSSGNGWTDNKWLNLDFLIKSIWHPDWEPFCDIDVSTNLRADSCDGQILVRRHVWAGFWQGGGALGEQNLDPIFQLHPLLPTWLLTIVRGPLFDQAPQSLPGLVPPGAIANKNWIWKWSRTSKFVHPCLATLLRITLLALSVGIQLSFSSVKLIHRYPNNIYVGSEAGDVRVSNLMRVPKWCLPSWAACLPPQLQWAQHFFMDTMHSCHCCFEVKDPRREVFSCLGTSWPWTQRVTFETWDPSDIWSQ